MKKLLLLAILNIFVGTIFGQCPNSINFTYTDGSWCKDSSTVSVLSIFDSLGKKTPFDAIQWIDKKGWSSNSTFVRVKNSQSLQIFCEVKKAGCPVLQKITNSQFANFELQIGGNALCIDDSVYFLIKNYYIQSKIYIGNKEIKVIETDTGRLIVDKFFGFKNFTTVLDGCEYIGTWTDVRPDWTQQKNVTNQNCKNLGKVIIKSINNGSKAIAINPLSYIWPDGVVDSIRTNLKAGVYTVTISNSFGCKPKTTDIVVGYDSLPKINLSRIKNKVEVNISDGIAPYSYIWNNGDIANSTVIKMEGYSVTITDANGCSVVRNGELQDKVHIYPNPSDGNFNVDIKSDFCEKLPYRVLDMSGKNLKNGVIQCNTLTVFEEQDLPAGMYLLQVGERYYKIIICRL